MGTSLPPNMGTSWEGSHIPSSSVPPHVEVEDDLLHEMDEDLLAHEVDAECDRTCKRNVFKRNYFSICKVVQ